MSGDGLDARARFAVWLDGGLESADEADLASALAEDAELRAACAAEARTAAQLAALFGEDRAEATADLVIAQIRAGSQRMQARRASAVVARLPRRRGLPVALAAAAVLLIAVLAWVGWPRPAPPDMPIAARRIDLPAGGSITTAPGAKVFAQDGAWRLDAGEIAVEVAPHPAAAIVVVRTDEADLAVLGTGFAVQRRPGTTTVQVAHGRVAVRTPHGTCLLPAGGSATAASAGVVAALGWESGRPPPPWCVQGVAADGVLRGVGFPDAFATLGIDCRPLRLGVTADTSVQLRLRLSGGCPTIELWARTTDGRAWVWEEAHPPQDVWLDRTVPLSAWRDDATRSQPPPPGAVIDWWHVSTRDGPGRRLVVERLAITGLGSGGE
jgi:ferric-dicitrate binding protein FerR (iron transport regulator)